MLCSLTSLSTKSTNKESLHLIFANTELFSREKRTKKKSRSARPDLKLSCLFPICFDLLLNMISNTDAMILTLRTVYWYLIVIFHERPSQNPRVCFHKFDFLCGINANISHTPII